MNRYDEMRQMIKDAEYTMRAADSVSTDLARLLVGRCRKVHDTQALIKLKRELRDLDMRTGGWKKDAG